MTTHAGLVTDKPVSRRSWVSPPIFFGLGLPLIFFAIVLLARANILTFPLPNEDDAGFFFPSWSLAVHGTLRVPELNAPNGIFWVPHGFYVWLALFLRIFGATVEVARTVCQLTTATAAVLLVWAYARICRSRGFALLCGALLVSPGVIFSANVLRMESLILLLFATGLVLHSFQRRMAAAAVFYLGVDVHPALLIGATLYTVGIVWADVLLPWYFKIRRGNRSDAGLDRERVPLSARILTAVIVGAVAGAIALEGYYVLHHLAIFHQHMAFQIVRKAMLRTPMQVFVSKRGALLIIELLFSAAAIGLLYRHPRGWRAFIRELLPVFLVALGLSAYATFGREIPYNVYSYAVVPATFCCLAYRLLTLPLTA